MMIRINLLPLDRRSKEATPLAVILPVFACCAAATLCGFGWAFLHFGHLGAAQNALEQAETTLQSKQGQVAYVGALKAEQVDFETRRQTIRDIAASRVNWTKKLDQLFDVSSDDDAGKRFLMHFTQIDVKAPAQAGGAAKPASGEIVNIKGFCYADQNPLQNYNVFHKALQESAFFEGFGDVSNPAGHALEMEGEFRPKSAWTVDLVATMKSREAAPKPVRPNPANLAEAPSGAKQNADGHK